MTTRVFDGYKGLWVDFWGFDERYMQELMGLDFDTAAEHFGDFWDQPSAMLDDGYNEFLMDGHTGKDVTHSECHGFKCVDVVAESLNTRVFLNKDVANLVERSAGAASLNDFF